MSWISVKDQEPEIEQRILAVNMTSDDKRSFVCFLRLCTYSGALRGEIFEEKYSTWCIDTQFKGGIQLIGGVTHWMPLPSLPSVVYLSFDDAFKAFKNGKKIYNVRTKQIFDREQATRVTTPLINIFDMLRDQWIIID